MKSTFDIMVFQSLAVVTLGDKQMAQRIDNLADTEELKRFYLQVCLISVEIHIY